MFKDLGFLVCCRHFDQFMQVFLKSLSVTVISICEILGLSYLQLTLHG